MQQGRPLLRSLARARFPQPQTNARRHVSTTPKSSNTGKYGLIAATAIIMTSGLFYVSTRSENKTSPISEEGKRFVDEIFKRNEKSSWLGSQPVYGVFTNQVASNSPIEDYHCEYQIPSGLVFSVFDGHGGFECAELLTKYLSSYVGSSIANISTKRGQPPRTEQVKAALEDAFTRMDNDIVNGGVITKPKNANEVQEDYIFDNLRPAVAGSCALVAYVEKNDLYVACTGDSRAVLARKNGTTLEAVPLSVDQTTRNPLELQRLYDEHPGETDTVVRRGRVLGGLMPTRAFGDSRYKWNEQIQRSLMRIFGRESPRNLQTPPYVTAKPVVTHHSIDAEKDMFVVLGSDGLYDELSNEEVVKAVSAFVDAQKKEQSKNKLEDSNVASHLIRHAIGRGDAVLVEQRLRIPAPISRSGRDDITVTVLFLQENIIPSPPSTTNTALAMADPKLADKKKGTLEEHAKYMRTRSKL